MNTVSMNAGLPRSASLESVLPQSGRMRLVDEVLELSAEHIRLGLVVRNDGLFNDPALSGHVSAWVGLEYMAQAIAAHLGFELQRRGEAKRSGFLLGSRLFESNVPSFAPGLALTVTAQRLLISPDGLGVYQCQLDGPGVLVTARVNGFLPKDVAAFWATVAGES